MNKKTLTKLEFYKITELLMEEASTPGGQRKCRNLKPSTDLTKIEAMQEETAAAFTRIVKKGHLSFSGCYPIEDSMKRLEVGAALNAAELLRIAKVLTTAGRAKAYGRHETVEELADCLDSYFDMLEPVSLLSAEIDRCIITEDEISDDASSTLKQIRRQMP